jgi:hypothetical protein
MQEKEQTTQKPEAAESQTRQLKEVSPTPNDGLEMLRRAGFTEATPETWGGNGGIVVGGLAPVKKVKKASGRKQDGEGRP